MRAPLGWFVAAAAAVGVAVAVGIGGCGRTTPPGARASSQPAAIPSGDAREQLSARAAAAEDRRFVAGYTLTRPGRPVQAVLATVAKDGTWRVDVQGGALGGAADIAIVGRPDGQYQCALSSATSGCVRVAGPNDHLPAAIDPRVQYPFTSWLGLLTDRRVAVSVAPATPLPNVSGTCYSVEPTTVTMAPPIESAVFCYADDGTLTGVRAGFGTLTLSANPAPAPATVSMPGPVVVRAPLPTAAPPTTPAAGSGSPPKA